MEDDKVRAWYDKSVDIFYLLFKEGPSHEVIEDRPRRAPRTGRKRQNHGNRNLERRKKRLIKQVAKAIAETA